MISGAAFQAVVVQFLSIFSGPHLVITMKNTSALAIMLKAPEPGSVKTRLVPPLTSAQAAGLYKCFLNDIFSKAFSLKSVDVFAAFSGDRGKLTGIIPEGVGLISQEGADLGERMCNVFKVLFEKGYKKVSMIGSDSPDLPIEFVERSFGLLDSFSIVLGPALDGGYYLIAMDRLIDAPFSGIRWSTGTVFSETIEKLDRIGAAYGLLKPWHDIDNPADLRLLEGNKGAPASWEFIKGLNIIP